MRSRKSRSGVTRVGAAGQDSVGTRVLPAKFATELRVLGRSPHHAHVARVVHLRRQALGIEEGSVLLSFLTTSKYQSGEDAFHLWVSSSRRPE